jgi:hypothetical protein
MKYEGDDYHRSICLRTGYELVGWPVGITRRSPSKITTMDEIMSLHEALTSRECRWEKMSATRVAELKERMSGQPQKKRSTRADKGVPRGKRKVSQVGPESALAKRAQKKLRAMLPPKSKETIDSSDEEGSRVSEHDEE